MLVNQEERSETLTKQAEVAKGGSNSNLHSARRGSSGYVRRTLPSSSTRGSIALVRGAATSVTEGDWDRFWSKVDIQAVCWIWTKSVSSKGYGQFSFGGRSGGGPVGAHVFAWLILVGEIGVGLELDHLCRVKTCVNPDHLEPVIRRVNTRRGDKVVAALKNTAACSIVDCDEPYLAKSLCKRHYNMKYQRNKSYGVSA